MRALLGVYIDVRNFHGMYCDKKCIGILVLLRRSMLNLVKFCFAACKEHLSNYQGIIKSHQFIMSFCIIYTSEPALKVLWLLVLAHFDSCSFSCTGGGELCFYDYKRCWLMVMPVNCRWHGFNRTPSTQIARIVYFLECSISIDNTALFWRIWSW